MDQVNAMQQYITKLQSALSEQSKQNKDLESRFESQKLSISNLEEKLTQTEIKYSREKEQVEMLEIKVDEYEKKLRSIQESKKPGFLGKMFSSSQIDQYIIKIKDLEHALDLQQQETEKLHAQIFCLKTQLQVAENKIEEEQKIAQDRQQKFKQLLKQEQTKRQKSETQVEQLLNQITIFESRISNQCSDIDVLKSDIASKSEELQFNIQLLGKNTEDLRKLRKDFSDVQRDKYINQLRSLHLQEEKQNYVNFVQEIYNYATGLQITFPDFGNSLQDIVQKIHQKTPIRELYLNAKPENYSIFKMAQERILKLGKRNEQLLKQNKQLQDRLQLQKKQE